MATRVSNIKDILARTWLRRGEGGILSRRLCEGLIAQHLPTDQPQVNNRQADALIRNEKGKLHHIEFQATNEPDFPFRMLEYHVYFFRQYQEPVHQTISTTPAQPTASRSSICKTTAPPNC